MNRNRIAFILQCASFAYKRFAWIVVCLFFPTRPEHVEFHLILVNGLGSIYFWICGGVFLCVLLLHTRLVCLFFSFSTEKLPRLLTTHGKLIFWLCQRVHAQARSSDVGPPSPNIFPFSCSHSQNVYVHKMKMSVQCTLYIIDYDSAIICSDLYIRREMVIFIALAIVVVAAVCMQLYFFSLSDATRAGKHTIVCIMNFIFIFGASCLA